MVQQNDDFRVLRLKGNFCEMGQGGVKPDDVLLRVLPYGRWVRITRTTWEDMEAWKILARFVVERPYWGDMYKRAHDRYGRRDLSIKIMGAREFLDKVSEA